MEKNSCTVWAQKHSLIPNSNNVKSYLDIFLFMITLNTSFLIGRITVHTYHCLRAMRSKIIQWSWYVFFHLPYIYIYIYIYIYKYSYNKFINIYNHKYSFSHEHQKNQTALSKHYWGLKNKGLTPDIQWSLLKRSNTPKSFDSRCNLCLEEKIHILLFPEPRELLNKRNELIARCRHRAKFKL